MSRSKLNKLPNPAWATSIKTMAHTNVSGEDLSAPIVPTAADQSKWIASDLPHALVDCIYELKQTVYDLAQHVCSGGKSDGVAVAVSSGVKLRFVNAAPVAAARNPQERLRELQSRVQDLLHEIEKGVSTDHARTARIRNKQELNTKDLVSAHLTLKFPVFWAHLRTDPEPRDIVVLAPGETNDPSPGSTVRGSQFQVYRAVTIHAQEMLESLRSKTATKTALLRALRSWLSLYKNLFTAPCSACGDLLKMEPSGMLPPCVRTESGAAFHSSCACHHS